METVEGLGHETARGRPYEAIQSIRYEALSILVPRFGRAAEELRFRYSIEPPGVLASSEAAVPVTNIQGIRLRGRLPIPGRVLSALAWLIVTALFGTVAYLAAQYGILGTKTIICAAILICIWSACNEWLRWAATSRLELMAGNKLLPFSPYMHEYMAKECLQHLTRLLGAQNLRMIDASDCELGWALSEDSIKRRTFIFTLGMMGDVTGGVTTAGGN